MTKKANLEIFLRAAEGTTIYAPVTAFGRNAMAIVRVSGKHALLISDQALNTKGKITSAVHACAKLRKFQIGEFAEEAVVTVFRAPKSFTGEDIVEISVLGGSAIVHAVMNALCDAGALLARPGEFSFRALFNGKLTALKAEDIANKIAAQSKNALISCNATLLNNKLSSVRDKLLNLLVRVTGDIEFAFDEDFTGNFDFGAEVFDIIHLLRELLTSMQRAAKLFDGIELAIIGEPNVGKSTLFNVLCGTNRAIVSSQPGTTRDTIDATLDIKGNIVRVIDTAGLRDTADIIEREGVLRTQDAIKKSDIVIFLQEASQPAKDFSYLSTEAKILYVFSKADLGIFQSNTIINEDTLFISAEKRINIDVLLEKIAEQLEKISFNGIAASTRISIALQTLIEILTAAHSAYSKNLHDVFLVELEHAEEVFAEIFDENPHDIYETIFANFCIGK